MSSLPAIGDNISVTSTSKNGEKSTFYGTYSPEKEIFVLRPLPDKIYIEQYPNYPGQGKLGWNYDDYMEYVNRKREKERKKEMKYNEKEELEEEELEEEELDPLDPTPVDFWGTTSMVFPRNGDDVFTWELLKPFTRETEKTKALKAEIQKAPYKLQNTFPGDGLTPELLVELMNVNGLWLQYVSSNNYKTREICLAAINQNATAIRHVPDNMLKPSKTSSELISAAIEKQPNIMYLELKPALLQQIKDYDPHPIPPVLKRNISATHSDQGRQGVCGRHAFSRVIVKNFFELILPLKSNNDQEKDCNKFLSTYDIVNTDVILELSRKKCLFSGYVKILLFLHCFFLFQTHIPTVEDRPTGWLECVQVSNLYDHFYTSIQIPGITPVQLHDLKDTLYTLKTAQTKHGISLVTFHFNKEDITIGTIKKITEHGLYIMLRIEDSSNYDEDESFHSAHFVIIVGAFDNYMLIKNSWNSDELYKINFSHPFFLSTYTYDTLTDCSFVIPVTQKSNQVFNDLTHVDSYLQNYYELKTKFNNIVVNVINSCPSENKEPAECDTVHKFLQQKEMFHPNNNPRCKSNAKTKYQNLMKLKGCQETQESGNPLLIANFPANGGKTRKKRVNKKTKRRLPKTRTKKGGRLPRF